MWTAGDEGRPPRLELFGDGRGRRHRTRTWSDGNAEHSPSPSLPPLDASVTVSLLCNRSRITTDADMTLNGAAAFSLTTGR